LPSCRIRDVIHKTSTQQGFFFVNNKATAYSVRLHCTQVLWLSYTGNRVTEILDLFLWQNDQLLLPFLSCSCRRNKVTQYAWYHKASGSNVLHDPYNLNYNNYWSFEFWGGRKMELTYGADQKLQKLVLPLWWKEWQVHWDHEMCVSPWKKSETQSTYFLCVTL